MEYCNNLKLKEEQIPKKIDMDVVNALDKYVPLLSKKSLKELKKLKSETSENEEMYVLLDRAIKYKKQKENQNNKGLLGMFLHSLFFDNKLCKNKQ